MLEFELWCTMGVVSEISMSRQLRIILKIAVSFEALEIDSLLRTKVHCSDLPGTLD